MAGLFSRLKIWAASETVTNIDLNAEFNNILANVDAMHSEGYSQNIAQMQTTEDPGGVGTENLIQPISSAQEIERLRFVIARITGEDEWYEAPSTNLQTLQDNLSQAFAISPDRVINGNQSANSSQPTFLQALGAGGVEIVASPTNPFSAYIDNNLITLTSNVVLTGLSAPPASGNTATLLDSFQTDQFSKSIQNFNLNSPGSEIVARLDKFSAFKIVNGTPVTEYFVGTVKNGSFITYSVVGGTTTGTITPVVQIAGIQRGSLFNSSQTPSTPITLTTGHTITLLRMTYVFLKSNSTLDVTYNPLSYQATAPTGAGIGDYWYDTSSDVMTWKRYNGSFWVIANAIFVGICAQDGANTVLARSVDFYNQFSALNEVLPSLVTDSTVSTSYIPTTLSISVYGNTVTKKYTSFLWDITSQLVPGETETASTMYYLYVKEGGDTVISALKPLLDRQRLGYYHPYETWRAVGSVFNDAGSNFDMFTVEAFNENYGTTPAGLSQWDVWPAETVGEMAAYVGQTAPKNRVIANGNSYNINQLPRLFLIEGVSSGTVGSGFFNVPDMRGNFLRGVDAGSGHDPNAATRSAQATGGNVGNSLGTLQLDASQGHIHNENANSSVGQNGIASAQILGLGNGGAGTAAATAYNTGAPISDGTNGTPRTATETRPVNVAFAFAIRF